MFSIYDLIDSEYHKRSGLEINEISINYNYANDSGVLINSNSIDDQKILITCVDIDDFQFLK